MKFFRIFFFEFEFFENWLWSDFWRQTIGLQAKNHRKSLKMLENPSTSRERARQARVVSQSCVETLA